MHTRDKVGEAAAVPRKLESFLTVSLRHVGHALWRMQGGAVA